MTIRAESNLAAQPFYVTPLWPAGHLPLKGGDRLAAASPPSLRRWRLCARAGASVISPLEGEMAGRPEGGALPPMSRIIGRNHAA
ncbi:hypothetical protein EET67_04105 [Pseudaminobacter arsenicus]|uniref:Lytic murein transglycosylase n=1 Tax=Borborobacter arsenicus TaxID=1851146 RepID=A0A432V9Q1_9HYPH|nr:hypothetical protein EET67_04105 [Pseudaminobacter arsenicus]